MRVPLSCLLLAGCPHPQPIAGPVRGSEAVYEIAVSAASGHQSVEGLTAIASRPGGDDTWVLTTLRTEGSFAIGSEVVSFDSAAPSGADPWPLTLQHAVASVPAEVRFSESGEPIGLADPDAWKIDALSAVTALEIPAEALDSAKSLFDPAGYVRDLRRTFPGTPPRGGWIREESIAGVDARRVETCAASREGPGRLRWTCEGALEGPEAGPVRLIGGESRTEIVADRRGLVSLEGAWLGTLLLLDPAGEGVLDHPVGGRRLVVRR